MPWAARKATSSRTGLLRRLACLEACSGLIRISPRSNRPPFSALRPFMCATAPVPRSRAGIASPKERTSVVLSIRRNRLFSARISASDTNATCTSASRGKPYGRAARRIARRIGATSHGASPTMAMRIALAARGGLDAGDAVLGVRDALVIHAEKQLAESVLDALDVAEGEVALVQLPVGHALVDHAVDHRADRLGILLAERANRCLGAVGQHDDPGLLTLRTRPGIPVRALVRRLTAL